MQITENPLASDENITTAQTRASVELGSLIVGVMLSAPPLEAKILFHVAYLNAISGQPFECGYGKLAALVGAKNRSSVFRAVGNLLAKGRLVKCEPDNDEMALAVSERYVLNIISGEKSFTKKYSKSRPRAKVGNHDAAKIQVPPGDKDSPLRMTEEEWKALYLKLGEDNADLLVDELSSYLREHPNKYRDHYRAILNWDRMKRESGKKFVSNHPTLGTGYFPVGSLR